MRRSPLDELLERIDARRPRGPHDAALLVLVPHASLTREVEQRLLDRGSSCAGVHVLTSAQCIERILGAHPPRPRLSQANLASALEDEIRLQLGELAARNTRRELKYLARHASARRALLSTLSALRRIEAAYGLTFGSGGREHERGHRHSQQAQTFVSMLPPLAARIDASGCEDAAARLSRALSILATSPNAWPSACRVIAYAPYRSEDAELAALLAGMHAGARCATEIVADDRVVSTTLENVDAGRKRPRAQLSAQPAEARSKLATFSAQGAESELSEALRRVRELLRSGCRSDRIAIVTLRPEAYDGIASKLAARESVPLAATNTTFGAQLPLLRLALDLLALLGPAPRRRFVSTLRHPLLARSDPHDAGDAQQSQASNALAAMHRFDHDTRKAGAARGLDAILESFENKNPSAEIASFLRAMATLRDRVRESRSHAELAAQLSAFFADCIRAPDPKESSAELELAWRMLEDALADVARRDRLQLPLPAIEELEAVLERVLSRPSTTSDRIDGVAYLTLDEHGGRDFDHVFLVGMERSAFPPPPRENPHLASADLESLRSRVEASRGKKREVHPSWQHPTPELAGEAAALAVEKLEALLHNCRSTLTVSYCRADELGKPCSPSPWIASIAEALGRPRRLHEIFASEGHDVIAWEPRRRSSHRMQGSPSASDLLVHAGLHGGYGVLARVAREIASPHAPTLQRASDWLDSVDSFELRGGKALRFDPIALGPSNVRTRGIGVSDFDVLTSCPLRFYFRTVLRVRELPEEPSYEATSSLGVGNAAHKVCENVYESVFREDCSLEERIERATALIEREIIRQDRDFTAPLERELSKLGDRVRRAWKRALIEFVSTDLQRMDREQLRPTRIEEKIEATLQIGEGEKALDVTLKGKIDRFDQATDPASSTATARVIDYKTGRSVKPDGDLKSKIQKLEHTQLPIYALMVEETTGLLPEASLYGIAPIHRKTFGARFPELSVDRSIWAERDALLRGFGERAAALVSGDYVLREKTPFPCNYCEFRAACPRHHPPTRERLRRHQERR